MTERQFATLPIKKVFFYLTIPSILSMVSSSIYMMADGIFVGRFIGSQALAAVNLVMPIIMIVLALPNMIAVGSSVKVSTALGEGNIEKAKHLFSASVLMVVGTGLAFTLLGILFLKPLIDTLIRDAALAALAYDYARFFVYGLPFIMPLFAMDNFLRVCGRAKYSMCVNVIVSVLNIALDWFFIVRLGLGIEFSAISTGISMILGSAFSFAPFFTKKMTLHFAKPQISANEVLGILYNGSSEFFSGIAGSFLATVINGFLLTLGGATAVASYGIVMYIDTLLVGVLYGVLDAIQPAVSYNLGAKKIKRTFSFFKISSITTAAVSLACMVGILAFPDILARVFAKDSDQEVTNMTIAALILFAPSYLFTWYNMVTSAFLTAMDRPKESMLIMAFQAIIFPLICLVLLTLFMGVYGVFFAETLSGALTFVAALVIWNKSARHLRRMVPS
ncbi:MAG: MATE family efflux transporter [Lachnospiraceae bacterium]|nr:MATE family efflux transporter [Lachnospiraceae bacterium]